MRGPQRRLQGYLGDRNVVRGMHVQERHPGAVVEPAAPVDTGGDARLLEERYGACGEFGRAGGG
jgi:hypothetical protein